MEFSFLRREPDLTTEKGVIAYIEQSTSLVDLRSRIQYITEVNNYSLPSFWFDKMVIGGVLRKKELELMKK